MSIDHPLFGPLDGGKAELERQRNHAQKLKTMMEERWKSPQVTNARRTARYTKPVGMGGKKGYDNDIFGE